MGLRASGGGLLLVPSSDGLTHGETFRQLEDFWYLTGLEVVQSMLVLDAERGLSTLFMPQRDPRFENPGRPNDFPGRPCWTTIRFAASAGPMSTGTSRNSTVSFASGWARVLFCGSTPGRRGQCRIPSCR